MSSSSVFRKLLIRRRATLPCMIAAIPNGRRNKGARNVLNKVSETNAVWESSIPPARVVYVANDAKATKNGAQFHAKNCEPSKY